MFDKLAPVVEPLPLQRPVSKGAAGVLFDHCTTRVTPVEWLRLPLVPVIVSVYVPALVDFPVLTVMVLVPEPATDVGLNVAFVWPGRPETLKLTLAVKPFTAVTETVYFTLDPWVTVWDEGVADMVKFGAGALTTSVTVVECARLPLVPVIVNV